MGATESGGQHDGGTAREGADAPAAVLGGWHRRRGAAALGAVEQGVVVPGEAA